MLISPKKIELICKIKTKKIHITGKFIMISLTKDFKKWIRKSCENMYIHNKNLSGNIKDKLK